MRKLATIQKILELNPIEGADAIERATILGWSLVVKKGEFKVGDTCIYCEIDSLMPDIPEFEFLKPRGMRIRTVRLRGTISQGIAFPLSILPQDGTYEEGTDVTELLGITKYEPPIPACLGGISKGNFPSFIPKTDEPRIQVVMRILEKYAGKEFYTTEKLDGSSATFYYKDGEFGVCSRNMNLVETETNTFWKMARMLDLENKMRSLSFNVSFQGELVGEAIQGNKLNIKGHEVRFFNTFDIDNFKYKSFNDFKSIISDLDLKTVPILSEKFIMPNNIDDLIKLATMKSTINPSAWAEGIIFRPLIETIDSSIKNLHDNRVSFKVINPEFLLKYGE